MAVTSSWVAHYLRIGQVGTCYNESCCLTGSHPAEALVVVFIVKMLSQKKKKMLSLIILEPKVIKGKRKMQSEGDRYKMVARIPSFYPPFS
jgi:hypothetical protein